MIEVKLYLYDSEQEGNGYRGRDLSAYVLAGMQNTENLTEELDESEITLNGYEEHKEFAPETKFIIDIYEDGNLVATYHRIVQEDVVEQPIMSDKEYFNHTITMIEPSAVAQKRIVDNIAITYKLKDVNLETRPAFDINEISKMHIDLTAPVPQRGFANYVDDTGWSQTRNTSFGKYFDWKKTDNSNQITVIYTRASDSETVESDKYYNDINDIAVTDGAKYIQFELPAPHIMWGKIDGSDGNPINRPPRFQSPPYGDIGIASFVCKIIETAPNGDITTVTQKFISSSNLGTTHNTDFPYNFAVSRYPTGKANFVSEYLIESEYVSYEQTAGPSGGQQNRHYFEFAFCKYTDTQNGQDFLQQNAITDPIEVKENCTYSIELSVINLATAEQGIPIELYPTSTTVFYYNAQVYQSSGFRGFCYIKDRTGLSPSAQNIYDPANYLPVENYAPSIAFQFYRSDGGTILLQSGIEYSALNLIKKAIIASDVYFKESDVYSCVDFDHPNQYPFYIQSRSDGDTGDIVTSEDLATLRVNETFFRQKNLWEILIEVGKYAHAIPQITFGDDDKFAISFYKLGGTNKTYKDNARMSVMNFRKIDDYVSACSSYIDNLVQLGGKIAEIVPPKTTHEQYLVYNDTAEIITSKPIIELLSVKAVSTIETTYTHGNKTRHIMPGDEIDLTNYIFEKNVYNLLSIDYDTVPNKGIALYYELGENVIKGGDYQLPQKWTNPYTDFSFKKIIFSAALSYGSDNPYAGYPADLPTIAGTGPWGDIKINDFLFKVEYRTKDTARIEHTRPDLRHYLLMSKYDKVPMHRQFNNQQDILVDSVSFGGNMFGKLIRTGNTNYKISEWCESFSSARHKGELDSLDDNGWYYVARVTNVFYPDHIESSVEYSKDYNQLSEIIGIPSEPRFYEISEQSAIDREVAINDYLIATNDRKKVEEGAGFIVDIQHTKNLVFSFGTTYLQWAKSVFKGDEHMESANYGTFGLKDFEKATLSPVNAYSCGTTLTYEWDMSDNLSAGDQILDEDHTDGDTQSPDANKVYRPMRAVQYCDTYGKATLFDFELFGKLELSDTSVRRLPECPILEDVDSVVKTPKSIVLLKDCREVMHFNYNLMLITDSDTFIFSPFFFTQKKNLVKIVLLSSEVNKLSNGYLSPNSIIGENTNPTITTTNNFITVDMSWIREYYEQHPEMPEVNAVAIMEQDQPDGSLQKFIIAKNGLVSAENWYFGYPNKDYVFEEYQSNPIFNKVYITVQGGETVSFRENSSNMPVEWGDGTIDENNNHTYYEGGDYLIKIPGTIKLPDDFTPDPFHTIMDYGVFGDSYIDDRNTEITKVVIHSIGRNAFAWCVNLNSMQFDSKARPTEIPPRAFYSCTNLRHAELPDSVRVIGAYAFDDTAIGYIKLPSNLTTIEDHAFFGIEELTEISFPASLKTIGGDAFGFCRNLATINMEAGVELIDSYAFEGITNTATTINYNGTMSQWNAIEKEWRWYADSTITVVCKDGTINYP